MLAAIGVLIAGGCGGDDGDDATRATPPPQADPSAGGQEVTRETPRPDAEPRPRVGPPRLILWVGCEQDVVSLTDGELDEWKSRGVDGFVCMGERLRDLGGSQDFTGNPAAGLNSSNYRLQRALRDSNVVERAAARGMKMYLGVKLTNYYNPSTPLLDWFDGRGWKTKVLPKLGDVAAAAKLLGFAGIAFDQEMYPQQGGAQTATWEWDYPGNTHSEAQVREQARRRGAEAMDGDPRRLPESRVRGLSRLLSRRLARADPRGGQRPHQHVDRSPRHRFLERDDERRGLRRDPLLRLGLLQGPAQGQLGQRPHLQPKPGLRHLLSPLLQLGLRLVAGSGLALCLDRRRAEVVELRRCPSPGLRRRAAARLSQMGHGGRVRKLRLCASGRASITRPT